LGAPFSSWSIDQFPRNSQMRPEENARLVHKPNTSFPRKSTGGAQRSVQIGNSAKFACAVISIACAATNLARAML
jgi:hypothetical protein